MTIYLLKDGNEIGPLEPTEVQALIDTDCIAANLPVRLGDGTTATAGTVPGIRLIKPEAPAAPLGQATNITPAPMASLARDVKLLKRNSAAVTAELNQFMREMRGKSPREMLGAVARSSLLRSGFTAAILLVIILFSATIIPFATRDDAESSPQNGEPQPVATSKTNAKATAPSPAATANTNASAIPPGDDKQKLADKLSIGETKQGQPSEPNPFEATDDLLQELE
ncbi:MAG: hypothetical protein QF721_03855 [Verrucomicrobiota bacterium]|jgi:hypothetical protein|nr:hypothetical protein [Verrucomicrobiota bacterium]MDP7048563.1 hypothetical protein [Verrucomicrobiota bacterium]